MDGFFYLNHFYLILLYFFLLLTINFREFLSVFLNLNHILFEIFRKYLQYP
jgi:hypothetical protein